MKNDQSTLGLAVALAVETYQLSITRALCFIEDGETLAARDECRRADAAHYIIGLLLQVAEAADEVAQAPTQITVETGSSKMPAPDDQAALALDQAAPPEVKGPMEDDLSAGEGDLPGEGGFPDAGAVHGVKKAERELIFMDYECDGLNCPDRPHNHKPLKGR